MHILRVFNNNVALAKGPSGEVVVTGRGVGFGAKQGDLVDETKVHKVFVPSEGRDPDHLAIMLADIPGDVVAQVNDTFDAIHAPKELREKITLVVAIADHLNNAIKRADTGEVIVYPLEAEVAHLYPEELSLADDFLSNFSARVGQDLPKSEAVALALHFVNAGFTTGDLAFTYRMTGLIEQLLAVIGADLGTTLGSDISVARLITHLRYLFTRIAQHDQLTGQKSALSQQIQESYPQSFETANKIASLIELRFDVELSSDEVSYLTLHVARLGARHGSDRSVSSNKE
ncbi:PRD domain-containing protein [Corynebacterium lubricantis]|uniref:PRD domain-containing protein n=1 Tax=Corynebacterium lubricantis TaxID=541095 RepID=UPI00038129E9|nr:PRD domain-containing protein [Corynebacterium lubricantis]